MGNVDYFLGRQSLGLGLRRATCCLWNTKTLYHYEGMLSIEKFDFLRFSGVFSFSGSASVRESARRGR